jgi:hypothetical protein
MVVYGWNSKTLKEAPFTGHQCASCGNESTHILVIGSYAHIFWIPIFPYRKYLRIVCDNCQLENKPKEVSENVRALAKQLKSKVRFPIYMFSGIGVIALLVAYFTIQGFMDNRNFEKYLNEPQANDIYHLYNSEEETDYKYYLWKVIDVNGDSVNISPNSFQYNYKPTRLETKDGFYDVFYTFHKDQLKEFFETDVIREIQRGFEPGNGFEREVIYELSESDSLSTK